MFKVMAEVFLKLLDKIFDEIEPGLEKWLIAEIQELAQKLTNFVDSKLNERE